jgi:hypothetical protein
VSDLSNIPFNQGPDKPDMISHQPVAARVPEKVARGVLSTGQLVLDGPKEFVIDFLNGLTRPHQVAARVVLAPSTMGEFIQALQTNLDNYGKTFGAPTPPPIPPNMPKPTIQEIYENFKLPDELLCGSYANSVLIGHSATEFFFDFITGFYPTSAVAARIFLAAPQIPRFLTMLNNSYKQHRERGSGQQQPPPPEHQQGDQPPSASN